MRNRPRPDGPAFEAATVRPNTSGETRRQIEVLPGGRFNAINMTLWQILSIAYPIDGKFRDEINLTGGPGWINSDRFDIIAKAEGSPQLDTNKPGSTVTDVDRDAVERIRMMLRRFLAERFKLRLHHETRQLPIYELVMAKKRRRVRAGAPEGRWRLRARLRFHPADGAGQSRRHRGFAWARSLTRCPTGSGEPLSTKRASPGRWISRSCGRRTARPTPVRPRSSPPSQEQLGLKLVPARGPVDVLVVDSAERPTPD